MKIAAVNFNATFADVEANLEKVAYYVQEAAMQGAELVLFPEFFPSAIGFSEKMLDVPIHSANIQRFLQELASKHNVIIGGSYLSFNGKETHNLFQMVFPYGSIFSHRKDIPTIAENCYYTTGDENHVFHTPIGDIGVALCWEMVRNDTLKRLSGRVDLVLAASCWADLPEGAPLGEYNRAFTYKTPAEFAKRLHTPVIHSNHCGTIDAVAFDYPSDDRIRTFQMIGATQMVDEDGRIIAQRTFDEGEGLIFSEFDLNRAERKPADIDGSKYWIEDLPGPYLYSWEIFGEEGRAYYENIARPYYIENKKIKKD